MLNIKKTFDVGKVEDLLSYRPENEEKPEKKVELTEKDIVLKTNLTREDLTEIPGLYF